MEPEVKLVFIKSGFTAYGKVWYVGHQAHIKGGDIPSWAYFCKKQQIKHYGDYYFRQVSEF